MPTNFTGGCLCGAIRYECTADRFLPAIVIVAIVRKRAAARSRPGWECWPQR
jgi:hypothetical protein